MPTDTARTVTVCSVCLRACCWQGRFMCDDAQNAGTVEKTVDELKRLNRGESSMYWGEND